MSLKIYKSEEKDLYLELTNEDIGSIVLKCVDKEGNHITNLIRFEPHIITTIRSAKERIEEKGYDSSIFEYDNEGAIKCY